MDALTTKEVDTVSIPKNMKLLCCTPIYPKGGTVDLLITEYKKEEVSAESSLFSVSNIIIDISGHKLIFNITKGVIDAQGKESESVGK